MRIVIRGGGFFSNKGAEAMLLTVHRELSRRIPELETVAIVPEEGAAAVHINGMTSAYIRNRSRFALLFGSRTALVLSAWRAAKRRKELSGFVVRAPKTANELALIGNFDAVFDISGFSYSDECAWGAQESADAMQWLQYCSAKNIPYYFLPQSWGPCKGAQIRSAVRAFSESAKVMYARDNISKAHLIEAVEITAAIKQGPDIAFLFEGQPVLSGRHKLEEVGVTGTRPLVGIVPNMRMYEKHAGAAGGNRYVQILKKVADYCTKNLGADVILIPSETMIAGQPPRRDDRYICGLLKEVAAERVACFAVRTAWSADEIKAVLGCLDLLIGSRFHSLVLALSSGVPCVAVGWSHKYQELMSDCGVGAFSYAVQDIQEHQGLLDLVHQVWCERERLRQEIQSHTEQIKNGLVKIFDDIVHELIS